MGIELFQWGAMLEANGASVKVVQDSPLYLVNPRCAIQTDVEKCMFLFFHSVKIFLFVATSVFTITAGHVFFLQARFKPPLELLEELAVLVGVVAKTNARKASSTKIKNAKRRKSSATKQSNNDDDDDDGDDGDFDRDDGDDGDSGPFDDNNDNNNDDDDNNSSDDVFKKVPTIQLYIF